MFGVAHYNFDELRSQLKQTRLHLKPGYYGSQVSFAAATCLYDIITQTFQNPLIEEYTLNYNRIPNMNYGIFLNQGILEGLGSKQLTEVSGLWLRLPAMRAR